MEIYWIIEEWIPAENAIGSEGYWVELVDGRFDGEMGEINARRTVRRLGSEGRWIQLVKVTREIVG